MKRLRNLLIPVLFIVSAAAAEAQCLSQYNHGLLMCQSTFDNGFTLAGCRTDALAAYYTCIGHSILD